MKALLARILLFSDPHWMLVPPGQQKGQIIRGIDRIVEGKINEWKWKNNPNFIKFLESVEGINFSHSICLGDLIECLWNERGIITLQDIERIIELRACIRVKLGLSEQDFFVPGDHEAGYCLPLSVDPNCGMSKNALENFRFTFGPLFQELTIGNFHLILISSSLIAQNTKSLKGCDRQCARLLKREQVIFLRNYLNHVPEEHRVFVFLHDPDALEFIDQLPESAKISKVFCGHLHAEESLVGYKRLGMIANNWLLRNICIFSFFLLSRLQKAIKLMTWAKGNLKRLELFKKYNLQIVPGISGMMGEGAGFLVLELYKNGKYEIKQFQLQGGQEDV